MKTLSTSKGEVEVRALNRIYRARATKRESQRDSGVKPRVARHELPWENRIRTLSNPNGVAALAGPVADRNSVGVGWTRCAQPRVAG
jgi:hypothetical protein